MILVYEYAQSLWKAFQPRQEQIPLAYSPRGARPVAARSGKLLSFWFRNSQHSQERIESIGKQICEAFVAFVCVCVRVSSACMAPWGTWQCIMRWESIVLHHCLQTSRHLHFKLQDLFAAFFGFVQPQVRKGVPDRYVSKMIFEARCTQGHKGARCQLLVLLSANFRRQDQRQQGLHPLCRMHEKFVPEQPEHRHV